MNSLSSILLIQPPDELETELPDMSAQDIAASFFGGERSDNDYFPYPNKAVRIMSCSL